MNNLTALIIILSLLAACQQPSQLANRVNLNFTDSQFTSENQLIRPNVDEWIFMGSSLGLAYAPGEFRNDRPGTFQIVHMEPAAYRYFVENGEYANGTMFSLSFYSVQEKPEPELNGFAQQDLGDFEIHMLDRERFVAQRGFYLFNGDAATAQMVPTGNECEECHNEHAQYDGTFTQFYPIVRDLITH
jgi:hypothetical protein